MQGLRQRGAQLWESPVRRGAVTRWCLLQVASAAAQPEPAVGRIPSGSNSSNANTRYAYLGEIAPSYTFPGVTIPVTARATSVDGSCPWLVMSVLIMMTRVAFFEGR